MTMYKTPLNNRDSTGLNPLARVRIPDNHSNDPSTNNTNTNHNTNNKSSTHKSPPPPLESPTTMITKMNSKQVIALYTFNGQDEEDLSFREGEIINVLDDTTDLSWWRGEIITTNSSSHGETKRIGIFPSNYVRIIKESPSHNHSPSKLKLENAVSTFAAAASYFRKNQHTVSKSPPLVNHNTLSTSDSTSNTNNNANTKSPPPPSNNMNTNVVNVKKETNKKKITTTTANAAAVASSSSRSNSSSSKYIKQVMTLYDYEVGIITIYIIIILQSHLIISCQAQEPGELSFHRGDIIQVLDDSDPGWWQGRLVAAVSAVPVPASSSVLSQRQQQTPQSAYKSSAKMIIGIFPYNYVKDID